MDSKEAIVKQSEKDSVRESAECYGADVRTLYPA